MKRKFNHWKDIRRHTEQRTFLAWTSPPRILDDSLVTARKGTCFLCLFFISAFAWSCDWGNSEHFISIMLITNSLLKSRLPWFNWESSLTYFLYFQKMSICFYDFQVPGAPYHLPHCPGVQHITPGGEICFQHGAREKEIVLMLIWRNML